MADHPDTDGGLMVGRLKRPPGRLVAVVSALALTVSLSTQTVAQSPSPSPDTASAANVAAYEWREVKPSSFGRAVVGEVAVSPTGRAVAFGFNPFKDTWARVFDTKAGRKWRSRALPGGRRVPSGERHVSPESIVASPEGLIGVGGDRAPGKGPRADRAVIWRSDTGAKWSSISTIRNAAPADIAAGPDGLLLAGERIVKRGKRTPTVWHSADGSAWKPQQLDGEGPPPKAVAISPDGIAVVRGVKYRNDGSVWTRLWRSADGQRWERADLPGGLSENERMHVDGPVATPRGFLLATREEDRIVDRLWHSADGLEWLEVPMPDDWLLERSWILVQPWPLRSLLLAARALPGQLQQPSLLLTADGGLTWCISDGPREPTFFAFDAAAGPDGQVVMVGAHRIEDSGAWVVRPTMPIDATTERFAFPCQPTSLTDIPGEER